MKKIFIIITLVMMLPLAGCHVSGSIGESSSVADAISKIC
jgi:hypothetical protein